VATTANTPFDCCANPFRPRKARRPAPKPVYRSPALLTVLKRLWFATDQMCSKKLHAAIPFWLPGYEALYGPLPPEVREPLLSMSPATIDRVLKPVRAREARKGLAGTRPGSLLKHQIPIRTHHSDITQPGFMEADTVAHCGSSLAGNFVWSLTMTDIQTTWTEIRATWNKGATGVLQQIQAIEVALPSASGDSIATTARNFSIITWCSTSRSSATQWPSPVHVLTKRTITPTSSKRTGPTYATSLVMIALTVPTCCP
jgi:hypothetical protein